MIISYNNSYANPPYSTHYFDESSPPPMSLENNNNYFLRIPIYNTSLSMKKNINTPKCFKIVFVYLCSAVVLYTKHGQVTIADLFPGIVLNSRMKTKKINKTRTKKSKTL